MKNNLKLIGLTIVFIAVLFLIAFALGIIGRTGDRVYGKFEEETKTQVYETNALTPVR